MKIYVGCGSPDPTPEHYGCCWPRCDKTVEAGGPPLCERHFYKVGLWFLRERGREMTHVMQSMAMHNNVDAEIRRMRAETRGQRERRAAAYAEQSQVYYVRLGDHVKIGYTINLRQRLSGLRAHDDAVLATEPGGRNLEQQRHREFAAERIGRWEEFNPSRRLLAHIDAVKQEHGEPNITGYFYVE